MAQRILGIEHSADRTAIVEVGFGRRLKVFNFAVIESATVEPERRAEQFQHTLKVRGFEARDAIIAISGGEIEHRLLTLPPMSARELSFVMQREAKKIAPTPQCFSSYEIVRSKEELGIRKEQILLVTAEQSAVQQVEEWFRRTPLRIQQVTTISESLVNLARRTGLVGRDAPRIIVHFSGGRLHLAFVQDGLMLLSRDVQFDYGSVHQDELVSRMVTEIKRSTLFFKQNFPQAAIDQILFSGAGDFLGALANQSKEDLGIATSVVHYEDHLDASGFRGDWDEFRYHVPELSAAIGAAWRKAPGQGINLLQRKPARSGLQFGASTVFKAAAALSIIALLLSGARYYSEMGRLTAQREELEARNAAVQPMVDAAAAVQLRRDTAAHSQALLGRMRDAAGWTELFRLLTYVVPDSAVFESIHVEGSPPVLTIRGSLVAPTAAQANGDFNSFYNGLRGMGRFSAVTYKPLAVITENVAAATPAAVQSQSRITFEVQCQLASQN